MIELQLEILAFLVIGYILGKTGKITQRGAQQLNTLVMDIVLPCSIFHAFQTVLTKEILESSFLILILATLLQLIFIFLSRLIWRKHPVPSERLNLEYGTVSNNGGTLGLVVGQAAFGELGALYTSIYAIPLRIVMWSYGLMLYSKAESVSWRAVLKKCITNPCMIAIILGILVMILYSTGFSIPSLPDKIIATLAGCNTALIMIVIGVILSQVPLTALLTPSLWLYSLLRLALLPVGVLLVLWLLHTPSMPLMICTFETAMPAPVTMAMLSQKFHQNEKYASGMILLSTALSMITLPLWATILATLF